MAQVILTKVRKTFGKVVAVDDFSLDIHDREFMVFVGPSGCGKTTTLRMIAGLESITAGEVRIGDRVVNDVPPKERDVAMVFQNYALYPHMTVFDNMAFGLKLKKVPRAEIRRVVEATSELLGISEFLNRKPKALSGGQRQRVALGRAIVRTPKVYLFDEPLSNLDAKLRIQMRLELKKLHDRMETTSIYVTHDQIEAMTMGDRIVVMKDGLVQQVGEPMELYMKPANRFVAGFIGSPTMNFIVVNVRESDGRLYVEAEDLCLPVTETQAKALTAHKGRQVLLGIRPDDFSEGGPSDAEGAVMAKVLVVQPIGSQTYLDVKVGSHDMLASVDPRTRVKARQEATLKVNLDNLHFFDLSTEKAIL